MKIILLSVLLFSGITILKSQSIAADWTLFDCAGNSHTLFTYLDNEEVVVMEFGMGCSSCTEAGDYLMGIKDQFAISNPGKVKVFYMDYWTGNNCATEVVPITDTIAFDAGFDHCGVQKNYYMTGTPMPAIVIVGGSNHLVLYEKNSFTPSDTTAIADVIINFFNTIGINQLETEKNTAKIFPNPSNGSPTIQLNWNQNEMINFVVFDLLGNEVLQLNNYALVKGEQEIKLSLSNLTQGNYILKIQSAKQILNLPLIIKI